MFLQFSQRRNENLVNFYHFWQLSLEKRNENLREFKKRSLKSVQAGGTIFKKCDPEFFIVGKFLVIVST